MQPANAEQNEDDSQLPPAPSQPVPQATSLSPNSLQDVKPLAPNSQAFQELQHLLYRSSLAGPPQVDPSHPSYPIAEIRTALGHALIERGTELILGHGHPQTAQWCLTPEFFPTLWLLANGNVNFAQAVQNLPEYQSWAHAQKELRLLPTQWGPPIMTAPKEGVGSTNASPNEHDGEEEVQGGHRRDQAVDGGGGGGGSGIV